MAKQIADFVLTPNKWIVLAAIHLFLWISAQICVAYGKTDPATGAPKVAEGAVELINSQLSGRKIPFCNQERSEGMSLVLSEGCRLRKLRSHVLQLDDGSVFVQSSKNTVYLAIDNCRLAIPPDAAVLVINNYDMPHYVYCLYAKKPVVAVISISEQAAHLPAGRAICFASTDSSDPLFENVKIRELKNAVFKKEEKIMLVDFEMTSCIMSQPLLQFVWQFSSKNSFKKRLFRHLRVLE